MPFCCRERSRQSYLRQRNRSWCSWGRGASSRRDNPKIWLVVQVDTCRGEPGAGPWGYVPRHRCPICRYRTDIGVHVGDDPMNGGCNRRGRRQKPRARLDLGCDGRGGKSGGHRRRSGGPRFAGKTRQCRWKFADKHLASSDRALGNQAAVDSDDGSRRVAGPVRSEIDKKIGDLVDAGRPAGAARLTSIRPHVPRRRGLAESVRASP